MQLWISMPWYKCIVNLDPLCEFLIPWLWVEALMCVLRALIKTKSSLEGNLCLYWARCGNRDCMCGQFTCALNVFCKWPRQATRLFTVCIVVTPPSHLLFLYFPPDQLRFVFSWLYIIAKSKNTFSVLFQFDIAIPYLISNVTLVAIPHNYSDIRICIRFHLRTAPMEDVNGWCFACYKHLPNRFGDTLVQVSILLAENCVNFLRSSVNASEGCCQRGFAYEHLQTWFAICSCSYVHFTISLYQTRFSCFVLEFDAVLLCLFLVMFILLSL